VGDGPQGVAADDHVRLDATGQGASQAPPPQPPKRLPRLPDAVLIRYDRLHRWRKARALYTMEFKHYSEAPKNVAEAVINKK